MAIDDIWYEILVRVDPSWIFNCILVCKGWLEEITGPEFRKRYHHKVVVGFMKQYSGFELFATTELGRIMKANKSKLPSDYFISKSGEGDGLILYGSLRQNILYVSKPGETKPIQLPRIQKEFCRIDIAVLSQHNSYKVVLIEERYNDHNSVDIHTFSPPKTRWTKSSKIRHHKYKSSRKPGIVSSSRGLVYWPQKVGGGVSVYDDNNEQEPVGWIDGPPNPPDLDSYKSWLKVNYGMSPQGYLQCAVSTFGSGPTIYSLFDDDADNKVWNKLYCVDTNGFSFVSFVPGRSDCIFVTTKSFHDDIPPSCQLSFYNLHTRNLATYSCKSDGRWRAYDSYIDLAPLTMADLGVWPSSPFCNTTQLLSDIYGIINTMDSTSPSFSKRRRKNAPSYTAFFVSAGERYAEYTWLDYVSDRI